MFDTDWADLQAAGVVYDPVTGVQIPTLSRRTSARPKAKGAEFELTFLPTENFLINLGFGMLDTAYTEIKPGTTTGHLPFTTGTEFAQAPDKSYTIGFQHTANFRQRRHVDRRRLDYNYQGQFWRSEPFLRVDAYEAVPDGFEESGDWGILNVRFTYEPADCQLAGLVLRHEPDGRVHDQLGVLPRHLGLRLRDGRSASGGRGVPELQLLRRPKVGGAHAPPIVDELQALASNRQRLFLGPET